jgi:hypothetical protein
MVTPKGDTGERALCAAARGTTQIQISAARLATGTTLTTRTIKSVFGVPDLAPRCELHVHGYAGGVREPDIPAHRCLWQNGQIQKSAARAGRGNPNAQAAHFHYSVISVTTVIRSRIMLEQ